MTGGVTSARGLARAWLGRRCAAWVAAAALLAGNLALAGARPNLAVAAANPIGVHSMLQLNSPYSFMQAMFAQAAGMHASAIRLDVAPALLFTGPSEPPDFSGLDQVMALSQQYHLPVVGDLFTIPAWIADCQVPTDTANEVRCGTDDLADYRSLITQIVDHADPVISDWEIWNEPDNGEFFTGTPEQYAQMLRVAHDAIKQVDPQASVLLGGISNPSSPSWLAQVFAAPGADAAHAFDIANVHLRGRLDTLAPSIAAFRQFLAGYGFAGPLWVTEHGYPSDPAFQYDPAFAGGPVSQAAYLAASLPTLVDAGASEVLVTERDNLGGSFASEGLLGGDVSDPPAADPQVVQKPAYGAVAAIGSCYLAFGRDCPGPPPAASPAALTIPAARLGSSASSSVSVSDPGPAPLQLGTLTLLGGTADPIAVQRDGCSGQLLEPDQTCAIALRFTPVAGGAVAATLQLQSDDGTLNVAVAAVAPSVSSLISPQLVSPAFTPTGAGDGVGYSQRLVLALSNPLSAPVHVAGATVSGPDARRFAIGSNQCSGSELAPGSGCRLSVVFSPTWAGRAEAVLRLRGNGAPLVVALQARAFALPAVTRLVSTARRPCLHRGSRSRIVVLTDQAASVNWTVVRRQHGGTPGCPNASDVSSSDSPPGRSSASGRTRTAGQRTPEGGSRRFVAGFGLPFGAGRRGLRPGVYRLMTKPTNAHGTGRAKTIWLTVLP